MPLGTPYMAKGLKGLLARLSVGGIVNFLYLVGVCNGLYSSGLALTICLLLLVGFRGLTCCKD